MHIVTKWVALAALVGLIAPQVARAQAIPSDDPVIREIWRLGMVESDAARLGQILMDSVGPRLTGAPGQLAAHDWAVKAYASFGIEAENEQYGTWTAWTRGTHQVDLMAPRVKTLHAEFPAWSGGTDGLVEGPAVLLPEVSSLAEFEAWLPSVAGKFVLTIPSELSCRHERQFEEYGTPGAWDRMEALQDAANSAFAEARIQPTGMSTNNIRQRLSEAGALGLLQSSWRGDGIQGILSTNLRSVPTIDLTCEDYGLVFRLAENDQGPVIRANIEATFNGTTPTYNTIATIPGTENPNEYVLMSSHFDSWDAGSGATDNGTGTIIMMEAMRILKAVYPNPKRTIISGHWSGEEQGLNGSEAWVADHPEVIDGMQALFNQDNGTGRVVRISTSGLTGAADYFERWLAMVPSEITQHIQLQSPGRPGTGGTDSSSFICTGAPSFGLGALSWDYNPMTHHTNLDTYDKIVWEEVRNNATLTAMLVYLASEEGTMMPRDQVEMPPTAGRGGRGGGPGGWPVCRTAARSDPRGGGG